MDLFGQACRTWTNVFRRKQNYSTHRCSAKATSFTTLSSWASLQPFGVFPEVFSPTHRLLLVLTTNDTPSEWAGETSRRQLRNRPATPSPLIAGAFAFFFDKIPVAFSANFRTLKDYTQCDKCVYLLSNAFYIHIRNFTKYFSKFLMYLPNWTATTESVQKNLTYKAISAFRILLRSRDVCAQSSVAVPTP